MRKLLTQKVNGKALFIQIQNSGIMESTTNQRLKQIIDKSDLSVNAFAKRVDVPQTTLASLLNRGSEPSTKTINAVLSAFPDINPDWLLTGSGEMYLSDDALQPHTAKQSKNDIPFYETLPVSAGQLEVVIQDALPTGFISIPGVHAIALFPVIGCSMLPRIKPGDIIGVDAVNSWDVLDPDKIYLIVTNEDRMIKHLQSDASDPDILWAISDNAEFTKFKLSKSSIKYIYRVTYHGEIL